MSREAARVLREQARRFRNERTAAEERLWHRSRNRQLGGFKFRRQHPIDRFIVDFCCIERRMIVEVDGPIHDKQMERDEARTTVLQGLGYRVERYTNDQIQTQLEAVLRDLYSILTI